jgi:hypothetical protein
MSTKLTYEEWRNRYCGKVTMAEDLKEELRQFHNIDAVKEIEAAMRKEYEFYLNGEYDK